jgi:hypothetical protein
VKPQELHSDIFPTTHAVMCEKSPAKEKSAALAKGDDANPELGDPRFVSSARLAPNLNPWSWFSTTPYLSILLADFAPHRLVIDPTGNYFWLSCATATRNHDAPSEVPEAARELVRVYSCLHRPN